MEDCISRIKAIHSITEKYDELLSVGDAIECLDAIPAADVVTRDCYERLLIENDELRKIRPVVHGKWELHRDGSATCSVCNIRQNEIWDLDNWQNYCGHCGADMRSYNDGRK